MRFTIRDLLWLLALAGIGLAWFLTAQRAVVLQARLQDVQRRIDELNSQNESLALRSKSDFATFEALAIAVKQADLSDDQRHSIRDAFGDQLQRLGVKTVVKD